MQNRSRSLLLGFAATLFLFAFFLSLGIAAPVSAATAGVPLNADENQMVGLVNQARINAGLQPLTVDPTLSGLARIKAQDIASNGYFSHYSPTYGSPFDMMKKAGVQYRYAGENIAKASTVSSAFQALMSSSGHRSNMLSQNYDRIGVGVVTKGSSKIIVQMFTGGQTIAPAPQSQPQPQPQPQPVSGLNADEQRMLNLVNQERVNAGLNTLQIDMNLVKLARMKAQDMINNGYFDHNSPTYGSPFDMMRAYGIQYRYAGENLAGAPTVDSAHTNLMNSPGHRANILNANYARVGVGVVSGGPYGKMFVQMFTG